MGKEPAPREARTNRVVGTRCRTMCAGRLSARWRGVAVLAGWLSLVGAGLPALAAGAAEASSRASTNTNLFPKLDFEPNLPVLFLEVLKPIGSEPNVPCNLRMLLPGNAVGTTTNALAARVRYHGATSQRFPKKSFALTLDQPARLLGLRHDAHWVLQAAAVDRSLMRHKLSYDLFRALSSPQSPRFAAGSRFVEVFLNGRYHGVYLLMERVDRQLLGMQSYHSNDVAHACLYKAVDHAANFAQSGCAGYEQREPEPSAHPYWEPLEQFNRFVNSASDAEFLHPQSGIPARLDVGNAMDFHLLVLLTCNSDGHTKNYFFGRDAQPAGRPQPRFIFAPWDYDATFGRDWDGSPYRTRELLSNHLFDRLLQDPGYRRQFAARWQQLRKREFSVKNLQQMMDANAQALGPAVRRNAVRWPTGNGGLTFDQDLAQMKLWVETWTAWLDAEIARLGQSTK